MQIISAQYNNAEHTGAIVITEDRGAVMISAADRPTEWADLQDWIAQGGEVQDHVAPPVYAPIDGATFLNRVTDAEYAAIVGSPNVQVRRWLDIFRLRGEIEVTGTTAQAAKAGLVALGLLTQSRADEIFGP